jgi:hypothetical protein
VATPEATTQFLSKVFGDGFLASDRVNFSVCCPPCREKKGEHYTSKKLVIRIDNLLTHCWVCGLRARSPGSLVYRYAPNHYREFKTLFKDVLGVSHEQRSQVLEVDSTIPLLPDGFKLVAEHNPPQRVWDYLVRRLGDFPELEDQLCYWAVGFVDSGEGPWRDRVILPSHSSDGMLNYYVGRSIYQRVKPKYRNPPTVRRTKIVFNEYRVDWTQKLTIVEGPFDLLKCPENSVAVLGSEVTAKNRLYEKIIEHHTPVILAFDNEAIAQAKQFELAQLLCLSDISVKVLVYPSSFRGDLGSCTREQVSDLLNKNCKSYNKTLALRERISRL